MTKPEMIPCPGADPHEKLPCRECGSHAGGCLYPLTPTNVCVGCRAPICNFCESSLRPVAALRCSSCATIHLGRQNADAWFRGFATGMILGVTVTIAALVVTAVAVGAL